MEDITSDQVSAAIREFLSGQLEKKLEPEQKSLDKCGADSEKAAAIIERMAALREKYSLEVWMKEAATCMVSQLRFGTHISKGIYPGSKNEIKGDNVNFDVKTSLPKGIVGSQTLANLSLDANGNAAALPLAAFFDVYVTEPGPKIRDLIQCESPAIAGVFAADRALSSEYAACFKKALVNALESPATLGRNKQVLWPLDRAMSDDHYMTLVPLYPSALTSDFFTRVNAVRYSDANKLARDNRKKKNAEQIPYRAIPDVAVVRLGGSNSQNIGFLTAKQRGRNYLLPSLPPQLGGDRTYHLHKDQQSLFSKRLNSYCLRGLQAMYETVRAEKNVVDIRNHRKHGLSQVLAEVLILAKNIQRRHPPGWSRDYSLSMPEKYWLDPNRASLEDEEAFAQIQEQADWHSTISEFFALWLNSNLRKKFPQCAASFGDAAFREWKGAMEDAIAASQRQGEGVFA